MKIKVEKKANKGSKEKINIKIGKYDSISDIFKSIPDNFWNIGGFIFMMLMLLILCAEEVNIQYIILFHRVYCGNICDIVYFLTVL